jgi:hypothetical protein
LPKGWLDGHDEIEYRTLGCKLSFLANVGLVLGWLDV